MAQLEEANESIFAIDFGTSSVRSAVADNTNILILKNSQDDINTPTCISLQENNVLFGYEALGRAAMYPDQTIPDIKSVLGKNEISSSFSSYYREFRNSQETSKPVDILVTRDLLQKMYNDMKENCGDTEPNEITKTLISIPASYTAAQRAALTDAARLAGLSPVYLIHDTTAAAMAYVRKRVRRKNEILLIFSHGCYGVDISIVTVTPSKSKFHVKAVVCSDRFKSSNYDKYIVKSIMNSEEIKGKEKKQLDRGVMLDKAKRIKHTISNGPSASVSLENITGIASNAIFDSGMFEEQIQPELEDMLMLIESAMERSQLSKEDIDKVILVGGSTRIPLIQKLMKSVFGDNKLNLLIQSDEMILFGTAAVGQLCLTGSLTDPCCLDISREDIHIYKLSKVLPSQSLTSVLNPQQSTPVVPKSHSLCSFERKESGEAITPIVSQPHSANSFQDFSSEINNQDYNYSLWESFVNCVTKCKCGCHRKTSKYDPDS